MTPVLIYLLPRTVAAVALAIVARGRGQPWIGFVGQLAADGLVVVLIAAFGDYEARRLLSWWAVPAWLYVAGWEGAAAARRWGELDEVGQDDSYVNLLTVAWRRVWDFLVVVPPVIAGLAVVTDLAMPGYLQLPGRQPAITCAPASLGAEDSLRVRLATPHGGELTVITPTSRSLIVVPFAAPHVPRLRRFEEQPETTLVVARTTGVPHPGAAREPVFTDTGLYRIRVSDVAEISASLLCEVRYVSGAASAPRR